MSAAIFLIFFQGSQVERVVGDTRRRSKRRDWIRKDPFDIDDDGYELPLVARELCGYAPEPMYVQPTEAWGLANPVIHSMASPEQVMSQMLGAMPRWEPMSATRPKQPWDQLPDDPVAQEAVRRMLRR